MITTQNPKLELRQSTVCSGIGVFANENIEKDSIVEECLCILEKRILIKDNAEWGISSTLAHYVFMYNNGEKNILKEEYALALGYGMIYNHSDDPNLERCYDYKNDRLFLVFKAKRNIKKDEELFHIYTPSKKFKEKIKNKNIDKKQNRKKNG